MLFVCSSGKEVPGDLRGIREITNGYGKIIKQHIAFDSTLAHIENNCVGSHRYEVTILRNADILTASAEKCKKNNAVGNGRKS